MKKKNIGNIKKFDVVKKKNNKEIILTVTLLFNLRTWKEDKRKILATSHGSTAIKRDILLATAQSL